MFKTVFTVTKMAGESKQFFAYFENYYDAFVFAKKEVIKINGLGGCDFSKRKYDDGSFLLTWDFDNIQILMDDNAWITDFRVNGIGFYDNSGLLWEFETMEGLRSWFALKKRLAMN